MKNENWLSKAIYYLLPLLKEQILTFCCIFLTSIVQQQYPLVLKIIIDDILINQNQRMFSLMFFIYIGLFILSFSFTFITQIMSTMNIQFFSFRIKKDLFEKMYTTSISYWHKTKMGEIVSLFNVDIRTISNFLSTNFLNMFTGILNIIIVIFIMSMLHLQLTLLVLITLPLFYLSVLVTRGNIKKSMKNRRNLVSFFNNFLHNIFENYNLMKLLTAERFFKKKFLKIQDKVIRTEMKTAVFSASLVQLTNFVVLLGNGIIIGYGVFLVFQNRLTIGGLVAFYTYIPLLFEPIRNLVGITIQFRDFKIAFQKIIQFLKIEKEIDADDHRHINYKINGNIDFQNVSFSYDEKLEPVLKDVSFNIRNGEKIALIGRNGSGKTTLVNLLLKMYPLTQGDILINDIKINRMKNRYLRKHLGIVTQKVNFFNLSIKENYLLACPTASEKDIHTVCQYTGASKFINELPDGYDTVIGEKGSNFSGGQLQKLAISRLILKNPEIIIFDEATSSLDPESVQMFYNLFTNVFKNKTVIFILHDIKRLIYADKAILLKNGKIDREYSQNDFLNEKEIYESLAEEVTVKN